MTTEVPSSLLDKSSNTYLSKSIKEWAGTEINPGETHNLALAVSESYSGLTVEIPIQIKRALKDGPNVFISGALHGDEINGTGAIRQLLHEEGFSLTSGSLILVPVLNILAFDRHSRYLPDRRDLNRCFPGDKGGNLASRMARTIFDEIVTRCDFGIDLHTAAVRRTNYPTVRADMNDESIARIARAFNSELILDGKGPKGSLRHEASAAGCPTIVMEGGEVWKVEPTIVESALRGIKNVLKELGMLPGKVELLEHQTVIQKTKWIRAEKGGFLDFHVKPGEIVKAKQSIATSTSLLGENASTLEAPYDGIIIGMTTLPATSPGEPICNLGKLPTKTTAEKLEKIRSEADGLEERIVDDLASNILVVDPPEES